MELIRLYRYNSFPVSGTKTVFQHIAMVIYWMTRNDAYYYTHEMIYRCVATKIEYGLQSNNFNLPLIAAHHVAVWHEYS